MHKMYCSTRGASVFRFVPFDLEFLLMKIRRIILPVVFASSFVAESVSLDGGRVSTTVSSNVIALALLMKKIILLSKEHACSRNLN